ncbi:MAG: right-handed parallel beta-helix repeat-containing protein [Sedimentisphaerales bacterium]|nr:right-handed parallel beta-helix repeat-containing protein [Sedimentisphaerales bacterium]
MRKNHHPISKLLPAVTTLTLALSVFAWGIEGDITSDGTVNWDDLDLLCEEWLEEDCSANNWCGGADIDQSNTVDFDDFTLLARNWLEYVTPPIGNWLQGCIHWHSTNSDGQNSLEEMTAAYRDCGGDDWTCVADHDYISNVNQYSTGNFLGINGVEATAFGPHVVGLGMSGTGWYFPGYGLQGHINNIIAGGGLPIVAHPNWSDASGHLDILDLMMNMTGCKHIEVYNNLCEYFWGKGNSEWLWDQLLSAGKVIYGTAGDDAHSITGAGYTYNVVGARELTVSNIKAAIRKGDGYFCYCPSQWASGINITDYNVTGTRAGDSVRIQTNAYGTFFFIGNGGRILRISNGNQASYRFCGDEGYVRTKVTNCSRDITWTQPVFVESGGTNPTIDDYEGYEPLATGGEEGSEVWVTSLDNSGEGTFRRAVEDLNGSPTIIKFSVGGAIYPSGTIRITMPNVTIAGETAPAPGITINASGLSTEVPFGVEANNVIVRHIRVRNASKQGIRISDNRDIIIDRCSITGSAENAIDINESAQHIVVSRCLFGGNAGCHNVAGQYISLHHNLYAWNNSSQPEIVTQSGPVDFRNNIVEYWTNSGTSIVDANSVNVAGNYYGPPAPGVGWDAGFDIEPNSVNIYTSGNYNAGENINSQGNISVPVAEPNVTTIDANNVPADVLADVGAQPIDFIDRYYISGGGTSPPSPPPPGPPR